MNNADRTKEELINELLELQKSYDAIREKYENHISLLKLAEEKNSRSEELFRKAFMTSSDSVNINRLSDGVYILINEGFSKILGYSEEDAIGKTSLELNIWADPENRKSLVKILEQKGRADNFEAIFRKKDCSKVKGLMSASLIDLDGVPHILNITRDITRLTQTDEALAREQLFIDALMNNLTDYIYIKDCESRFIRINKSQARLLGLDHPDQVIGKTDNDFYSAEHVQPAYEDEQEVIRTGETISKEEKLTHSNGLDTWVSTVKMPLRDNYGNILGTFGISRDITGRKRTELEIQINFEITQGITTTSNLDELLKLIHHSLGKVVYAENCFVALYDHKTGLFSFPYFIDKFDSTPLPTSMGKSCTAYVFRKVRPFLFSQKIFDQLVGQNEVELVGSASPSWIGIPLQTPSNVIGVLVLQHYEKENVYSESDMRFLISIGGQIAISIERKKTEEEIKLKNELLQALNAEKDKFFSIIAHDLRGPLSAFVAATRIITEEIQTMNIEEIKEITNSMKISAANIYNLLENLLEWSRLRRGGMDFFPEKLNLKKKINACIDVLSESLRKKGLEITISIPDDMEVFADTHMFDSVIRNLVSNAIKFTRAGGKVAIMADHNSDQGIEIKISDSGIGMTPELKNKLFLISEKTSRQGTEDEPSTGLGLLLSKEFIEKHGGKIWVESKVGQGSTFYFSLPKQNLII
jgi:PAS domain S-box-containing protein